ncbi:major capsid protein [Caenispirillum bisanense]|uniref:Phage major capsid protein E n=1 Tax=Caenispirillum bisanense TaxID=414052 RepID=A0A286GYT5_9PROT|nr:major capsid protein [Caenispirillum bisanense]SOE00667.1 Phage major capsid protein E [Caenispirillum bisanense]
MSNSQMNTAQARVIDPILSNHARGYTNAEHVGHTLFPNVPIPQRGIRRLEFGKEAFRAQNTRRAPGGATKRIQFGYEGKPVALEQHSLEGKVAWEHMEDASRVPGIDLATGAVNLVLDVMALGREIQQAGAARNPANYDANHKLVLAGADKWSDGASKPVQDVNDAKEAIRSTAGRYPNTMVIGPKVFLDLKVHPAVIEQFKYTGKDSITVDMLARYFDVERLEVGKAVFLPENAGDDDAFTDVWGNDVVLAWVPTAGANWQTPSYGYTYHLAGHPFVEKPYDERNAKSWFYPVTDEHSVELVGADAGFLIQGAH